ncbi:phosphatidylserine decarboxylase [Thermosulfuriphilus sp.]
MFFKTKINREGLPFVGAFLLGALGAWRLGQKRLSLASSAGSIFMAYFFRDPPRYPPRDPAFIIAPADGRIIQLTRAYEPEVLKDYAQKLSIFMTVFDVHINRAPTTGKVLSYSHHQGRFLPANKPQASQVNERAFLLQERSDGEQILTVQVAGILARRIVRWTKAGESLRVGERFGMIRLGSRLDLYFSPRAEILVKKGDRVKAGETPVAYLPYRG